MIRRLLITALACVAFAVALLVWQLAQGPVSLDFLTPYLNDALRDPEGKWRVEVGSIALMGDLRIQARDVTVIDAEGESVLSVPDIAVRPSLSALARGLLAPQTIEIAGAGAGVVRRADGSFGVTVASTKAGGADNVSDNAAAADLLGDVLAPPSPDSAIGFLRLVRITDAGVRMQDAESGTTLTAEHTEIVFRRSHGVHALTLKASLTAGGAAVTTRIEGELEVRPAGEGLAVGGRLRAFDIGVGKLGLYWPQNVAKAARRWVTERIPKGHVPEVVVNVAMRSERGVDFNLTQLNGSFRYEGLEVRWSDEAPRVTAIEGTATFDHAGMRFDVVQAVSDAIRIRSARIDLVGLDGDQERIAIEATGNGPLSNVIALIPKSIGAARVGEISGDTGLIIAAAFPLRTDLSFADVDLRVDAAPQSVRLKRTELDAVISGKLRYQKAPTREGTLVANLSVHQARVDAAPLHWTQPAQEVGEVSFQVSLGATDWQIDPLRVDCPGLQASGSAVVSTSAGSNSVNLRNVVYAGTKLDALAAKWERRGIVARLGHGTLDVAPLLGGGNDDGGKTKGDGGDGAEPDLDITAPRLSRVSIDADSWLENVEATLVRENGEWRRLLLNGDLPKALWSSASSPASNRRVLAVSLEPTGPARRLEAHADDLGALLRALNVSEGVRGGTLVVSGRADGTGGDTRLRAHVKATDFAVNNVPLLLRILTVAALDRFIGTMRGDGLQFDSLKGVIVARDGRYDLQDFRAYGNSLGWTANGWLDTNADQLALDGVLIPAYAANKVLKSIPLLGNLFTGRDRGGLIAISYKVKGDLSTPKVSTNALTALTPGMLREVWELGPK